MTDSIVVWDGVGVGGISVGFAAAGGLGRGAAGKRRRARARRSIPETMRIRGRTWFIPIPPSATGHAAAAVGNAQAGVSRALSSMREATAERPTRRGHTLSSVDADCTVHPGRRAAVEARPDGPVDRPGLATA